MKGTTRRVPIASLKRRPLRESHGTDEELTALARSWLERAIHSIFCRPDLTVADGHRRLLGLELLGETEVEVFVTDENLSDAQLAEIGLTTAIHRADLDGYSKWKACDQLVSQRPTLSLKALADLLHLDPSTITRLRSPGKCIPAWQEALRDGTVGIKDCYAASQLDEAGQRGLLALKLSGAKGDRLERAGRRARAPKAATVKAGRVVIPLPTGIRLVITGGRLDLEALIDALGAALSLARAANKDRLDVRTAEKVWADRSKAGA